MPTKTRKSHQIAAILVCLVVAVAGVGCGGGKKEPVPAAAPASGPAAPAPASSTPATKPAPSFAEQRAQAVSFLRQLNQAGNNFGDALSSAGLNQKIASGNVLQINAALTTWTQLLDGYQRQVSGLVAAPEVPETAALKDTDVRRIARIQQAVQQLRAAVQSGSQSELLQAVQQMAQLDNDPDAKRSHEQEQALLAKFNIPDVEVSYRRPR